MLITTIEAIVCISILVPAIIACLAIYSLQLDTDNRYIKPLYIILVLLSTLAICVGIVNLIEAHHKKSN